MAPKNCPPYYLVSSCWSARIIKMARVDMGRDRELTISVVHPNSLRYAFEIHRRLSETLYYSLALYTNNNIYTPSVCNCEWATAVEGEQTNCGGGI